MKKILALFLALLFSVSIFAGCGQDKKASESAKAQVKTEQSVDREKAKPAEKSEKGAKKEQAAKSTAKDKLQLKQGGTYTDKEHVAAYIHKFGKLPANYITKREAKKLGWKDGGTLDTVAPGKSIGGDRYGNYEGLLPDKKGRTWKECDIDYVKGKRNAKRIVFSSDGLIYYTGDHYKSFTQLY